MKNKRLTMPSEAERFIPPLDKFAGNREIKCLLRAWREHGHEHDANLLIRGAPGTGKTAILLAYLREKFVNPFFYREEHDPAWNEGTHPVKMYKCLREYRERQCGGKAGYFEINGASDSEAAMRSRVSDILYLMGPDHRWVLVDELGELFFRGLESMLRPVQTDPDTTTFATAQDFHTRRRTDTVEEEKKRLEALLRRFSEKLWTELPTEQEHIEHIAYLMGEWSIAVDTPSTVRRLVEMSEGVVGFSRLELVKAISQPDRKLTRRLLDDADPL